MSSSLVEPVEILSEPEPQSGPPTRHNSGHNRSWSVRNQEEVSPLSPLNISHFISLDISLSLFYFKTNLEFREYSYKLFKLSFPEIY